MLLFFYLLLFFLGAVMGSFGGVIIERGKEGFARADRKKIFGGRSYCPGCDKTLTWWQLIPLGGWLIQKGKCFRCKLQIPVWYLWEEILMGLVFAVTGWVLVGSDLGVLADNATSLQLTFWLILNRGLFLLLLADLFRYELNLYVWILLMVVGVGFQLFGWVGDRRMMIIGGIILSAVFYGIYMFATWWQTRKQGKFTEGFGLGDVWMAGLLGSLVGVVFSTGDVFFWVQLTLMYLIVSSGLGIVFWLLRKIITKNSDDHMPFLPAMILAFFVMVFYGSSIIGLLNL